MLTRRFDASQGKIGYLVKWKGYEDDMNSWVNEDDAAYVTLPSRYKNRDILFGVPQQRSIPDR